MYSTLVFTSYVSEKQCDQVSERETHIAVLLLGYNFAVVKKHLHKSSPPVKNSNNRERPWSMPEARSLDVAEHRKTELINDRERWVVY